MTSEWRGEVSRGGRRSRRHQNVQVAETRVKPDVCDSRSRVPERQQRAHERRRGDERGHASAERGHRAGRSGGRAEPRAVPLESARRNSTVGTQRQAAQAAGQPRSRFSDPKTQRRRVTETISYGEQSETNHESIFSSASGDEKAQASRASHSPKHLSRTPGERDGDRLGARGGVRVFPRVDRDAAPAADARARGAADEVRGAKSGAANVAGSERARVPPLRRRGRVVASAPAATRVPGPTGALQKRVVSRRRREDGGGGRRKNKPRGSSRRRGGAHRDARRSGAHPVLPHADFAVNPPLVPLRPHLLAVRHDGVSAVRAREGVRADGVAHPAV